MSVRTEISDDGKTALVEVAGRDRKALAPFLSAGRADVKVYEKGKFRKSDLESEFKKFKTDFDLDAFAKRDHGMGQAHTVGQAGRK